MRKHVLVAMVFLVLALGVTGAERIDATTEGGPQFPTVAVDQTRGPSPTANLVDDPGEWDDMGGGTDICTNPKSTAQVDKKCTFAPEAPELKYCASALTKVCREINIGLPSQKCKTCPS